MIKEQHLMRTLAAGEIRLDVYSVGDDALAVIRGGDKPHIGCTVMSIPRPSLTGDGSTSCTSSVINAAGHKDEHICRMVSEAIASALGVTTVCTGGFHSDNITEDGIREVLGAVRDMIEITVTDISLSESFQYR